MVCETYPKRTLSIPFNVSKLLYPMQVDNKKSLLPKKNRESRCASVCVPILPHSVFNTPAVYEALMMHVREFYGIRLFIAVPPPSENDRLSAAYCAFNKATRGCVQSCRSFQFVSTCRSFQPVSIGISMPSLPEFMQARFMPSAQKSRL